MQLFKQTFLYSISMLCMQIIWAQQPANTSVTMGVNNKLADTSSGLHFFSAVNTIDYAKKNNISIKNALLDVQIQQQTNKEITSAAYPQLNGSGTFNDFLKIPVSLIPGQFFGAPAGTYIPVQFGTKYNVTGGITLSQLLFDGQVFVGLQARNTSLQLINKQKEITEENIMANVYKIYYQLVVAKKQLGTIDVNIIRLEKLYKDIQAMYKQGFVERLDVEKMEVQLNNVRTEKLKFLETLNNGFAGLKLLINMPQKDSLILTDTLNEEVLKSGITDSYDYNNRKEYQLLQTVKKLNNYNVKRYKLSYIPTLAAFINYQKNAQRQQFDFFEKKPWFTTSLIGVQLNVPIFDGFRKSAQIKRAKIELNKTTNNIAQLQQSIDADVLTSKNKLLQSLLTVDVQERNMQLANKVYNTTVLKYQQGLGSNQEIYTAETEYRVAQNNYYAALYDAIIARVDYFKATGQLKY